MAHETARRLSRVADLNATHDYPLGERRPDLVRTPSGAGLDDLDIEALEGGLLATEDMRASATTLRLQADIADSSGRRELAQNLRRAAELTRVPDDVVLEVYRSLRPGRSNATALEDWAQTLETEFDAPVTAAFIRDAAEAYDGRGL